MEFPSLKMNRSKTFAVILILLSSHIAYSQDCKVFNTGRKSYDFSDTSKIGRRYEIIKNDSLFFNACLITKNALSNSVEMVSISIDELGQMTAESISKDSVLFAYNRMAPKSLIEKTGMSNDLNGFYESTCSMGSSHVKQILVVSNPGIKKWIELTCFDGQIVDVLKSDKELKYLFNIYIILSEIKHSGKPNKNSNSL